jgi:hypothetical protein
MRKIFTKNTNGGENEKKNTAGTLNFNDRYSVNWYLERYSPPQTVTNLKAWAMKFALYLIAK